MTMIDLRPWRSSMISSAKLFRGQTDLGSGGHPSLGFPVLAQYPYKSDSAFDFPLLCRRFPFRITAARHIFQQTDRMVKFINISQRDDSCFIFRMLSATKKLPHTVILVMRNVKHWCAIVCHMATCDYCCVGSICEGCQFIFFHLRDRSECGRAWSVVSGEHRIQ